MATFTNQATLSYNGGVTTSNIVTGELQQVLALAKSTLDDSYRPGDILTYVISIVNSGTAPLTDLTVTDDLGAYTVGGNTVRPLTYVPNSLNYYVGGARQADPVVTGDAPLTVTGINVPAGGNTFLVYQATANDFASPAIGGNVTNTATVTGDGLASPVAGSITLPVQNESFLTVGKTLSPTTVSEGDRLTYTFIIQNFGNTAVTVADNASITDTFDPILSDLVVNLGGQPLAETTDYTYNEATGEFATVAGRITVPAATYTQNPATGAFTTIPGAVTLTVTGTV